MKRSEEHTSELQSRVDLVCRLLLEKKKNKKRPTFNKKKITNNRYIEFLFLYVVNVFLNIFTFTFFIKFFYLFYFFFFFFFNDTATTEIYTLSLHDALPI